jgi:iron complex outermembrane recepter protein
VHPLSIRALFVCLLLSWAAWGQPDAEQSPVRKETIVVTGSYEPVPLEEADRAVQSLDVPDLRPVTNSLADLLRLDSSLDLRERAPNLVQGDLSIRGASFGQTLVLIDGQRLNDSQTGHFNLDVPFPLDTMDRVEVMKGSGSTMYGSDAVGGVVNLVTKRPESSELRVRGALGNWGVNQESASAGFVRDWFAGQLFFSRDFSTGFIPNRDYRNLAFSSKNFLDSRLGTTDITLAYDDRPYGAQDFYGPYPSWERTKGWYAGIRQPLGENTEVDFAYRRHSDLFYLYRYQPWIYTNRHITENYQAALRRKQKLGRNAMLFYGGEGYTDSIVSTNLGVHSRARGAGYVAFDTRALNRFSFTAGVRDEIYGSFNQQVSPSVAGGMWLGRGFRLRASASRAFRLPSYTDLYYHDPANIGSPNLQPETAWSYEGGVQWNRGGKWLADATAFVRRERNGIDYVRDSPTSIWRAMNFQRINWSGVESSLTYRLRDGQSLNFQYTYLHGAQDQLGEMQSKYSFNYPIQSGLASWQGLLPHHILTRVRVGAMERYAREPYAVFDAYAALVRGRVRPFLQLTNITGTVYQEIQGVPMPGRGIVGGLDVLIYPSR